jgi:hypothetical protein
MPMLQFLQGKASDRKLRLFAAACARRAWPLIADQQLRRAVEVAEQLADALADFSQLRAALNANVRVARRYEGVDAPRATIAVYVVGMDAHRAARWTSEEVILAYGEDNAERVALADLIRCVFGNPSRPSTPLPPAVLAWNDRTVPRLAWAIYQDRHLPAGTLENARLAILADAALDAGCDDEELIRHCRSEGPHVRGCWAVDLILGKS